MTKFRRIDHPSYKPTGSGENYGIDTMHGEQISVSRGEENALSVAQQIADERSEPVYVYLVGSDDEPTEVAPSSKAPE